MEMRAMPSARTQYAHEEKYIEVNSRKYMMSRHVHGGRCVIPRQLMHSTLSLFYIPYNRHIMFTSNIFGTVNFRVVKYSILLVVPAYQVALPPCSCGYVGLLN